MNDYKIFELGNLRLQGGMILPNARLTYQTYGALAADKSNVVLYPTSYGAHHMDIEYSICDWINPAIRVVGKRGLGDIACIHPCFTMIA